MKETFAPFAGAPLIFIEFGASYSCTVQSIVLGIPRIVTTS